MIKGFQKVGLITAFCLTCAFIWHICSPREPVYESKPLSYWLKSCIPPEGSPSAEEKIRHVMDRVGTNAVPTLLQMLKAKDSKAKTKYFAVLKLLEETYGFKIHYTLAWEKNYEGYIGFKALGARSAQAVPYIVNIYEKNITEDSQYTAIKSLGAIGLSADSAVPKLVEWLASKPRSSEIIDALGEIHTRPDLVVPVLTDRLLDPHPSIRVSAAKALGAFGADATSAVPVLIKALQDNDPRVVEAVQTSLARIESQNRKVVTH